MNFHSCLFLLFALLACGGAVAMVLSSDVVRTAVHLIISLIGAGGLFFLAGSEFVGAMQLMVYVGGTLVLLIFGVMLTAHGPFANAQASGGEWVTALVVGGFLFAAALVPALFSVPAWSGAALAAAEKAKLEAAKRTETAKDAATNVASAKSTERSGSEASASAMERKMVSRSTEMGAALVGVRADRLRPGATPQEIRGLSGYLLPFELISLYLLAVLIGAAYLARAKRRPRPA